MLTEEGIKKQTPDMTLLQVPEGWKQGRGAVLLLKTLPLLVFQLFGNSGNDPPTPGLQGQALPLGLSHDPSRHDQIWGVMGSEMDPSPRSGNFRS